MASIFTKSQVTWPYLKELTEYLANSRNNLMTTNLREGINHAIIFYSACYIEGMMEQVLKGILLRRRKLYNKINIPEFEIRRTTNLLFLALEEDLAIRISRSTGIHTYLGIL